MGEIYNNGSHCAYLSGSALEVVRTDTHFFSAPRFAMPSIACFIVLLIFGFLYELSSLV